MFSKSVPPQRFLKKLGSRALLKPLAAKTEIIKAVNITDMIVAAVEEEKYD